VASFNTTVKQMTKMF